MDYKFKARLWLYGGKGAWHFVTVPKKYSADINEISNMQKRGFGSVKVIVSVKD